LSQIINEADLAPAASGGDGGKLSLGARAWSLHQGGRDPYVIMITIYIFMPYVASVVVGDPVHGQELVSRWSQYAGWATALTAPFLGAAMDQLGRRKTWLALGVALMAPMIFALWWAKPAGAGLPVTVILLLTTLISLIFAYIEVIHNSLLVRAAGMANAHKASSLALALGNSFSLITLAFTAWAFALPGKVKLPFIPASPLFGLSPALHQPERIVGPISAVLLVAGTIPLLLFTPDAPKTGVPVTKAFADGARALGRMVRTVGDFRDAAVFLVSRMFYVDGMTAILIYSGIYATGVMKWGALEMLLYGIILTVLAVCGGILARFLDAGLGPKRAVQLEILMSLIGIIAILGIAPDRILFFWHYDIHSAPVWNGPFFKTLPELVFILIGFSNATFITAHYASSRTLLTRLTPPAQTGAFFGAYAVSGTATVWLGSFLVNLGTHIFKSQQGGFGMIAILLGVGFVGLLFVRGDGRVAAS
jgi:UMF1 family MFS transporter